MSKHRWALSLLAFVACAGALYALGSEKDAPPPRPEDTSSFNGRRGSPELMTSGARSDRNAALVESAAAPVDGKGSIVVVMVDAQGRRIEDSTQQVYLFWRAHGSAEPWERDGQPRCDPKVGEGRIDDVPVGKQLQLRVIDPAYFGVNFEASGPMHAGEVVTVQVPLGPRRPVLTGLLVDAEGRALTRTSVIMRQRLEELMPDGFAQTAQVQTDESGRFRKTLAYRPEKRAWLFIERDVGEVEWKARLQIPPDASGETNLGTIVLTPTSELIVIARGRVVDEGGQTLSRGVSVMAYAREGAETVILTRAAAKVQRDGTFAIRTGVSPLPETFRVEAHMRGRAKAMETVSRGAEGVVLRLVPGGRLHASFRVPAGVPDDRIVGYLQRQGSKHVSAPNQYGGRFGRDSLPAGLYDVFVKIKSSPWELLRVERIEVPAGGDADDARILDMSLEGLVRVCRVRVRLSDGQSLAGRHIGVVTRDGSRATFRVASDGILTIVAPPRYEAFTLTRPGAGTADVSWSAEEQAVTLR